MATTNEARFREEPIANFDPIERLLLQGRTVFEAEEEYLDGAYPDVLALLASPISNDELSAHPLLRLYRSYGSPGREDSLL